MILLPLGGGDREKFDPVSDGALAADGRSLCRRGSTAPAPAGAFLESACGEYYGRGKMAPPWDSWSHTLSQLDEDNYLELRRITTRYDICSHPPQTNRFHPIHEFHTLFPHKER